MRKIATKDVDILISVGVSLDRAFSFVVRVNDLACNIGGDQFSSAFIVEHLVRLDTTASCPLMQYCLLSIDTADSLDR